MKKIIIIAMLLTVLSATLLAGGVVYADETETTYPIYYFEKPQTQTLSSLPLRATADNEGKVLIYIPHSYAFEKLEEPSGQFVKVRYNGLEGFVETLNFNTYCKSVNDKWGGNPYAYTFNYEITASKIALYNVDAELTLNEDLNPQKANTVCNKTYGYYTKNGETYFYVNLSISIPGVAQSITSDYYIKASDTSLAQFNASNIPVSAGYTAQTAVEENPSGEINSGDKVPSVDDNKSPTQSPKNSLDRYILIAVIAVLCVVIVILIFVPNRKKNH